MKHTFELQPLTEEDIPDLITLHHSVGWNSPPEFLTMQMRLFLAIGKLFGHRDQGQLITCAGVYPYGTALASIGPVIVNPAYQRQGLGQQLMNRCLQIGREPKTTVMLIATEAGQRLYRSLGFETVGTIRRLAYDACAQAIVDTEAQQPLFPIQQTDLPRIIKADLTAIGTDRSAFYKHHFVNFTSGYMINSNPFNTSITNTHNAPSTSFAIAPHEGIRCKSARSSLLSPATRNR